MAANKQKTVRSVRKPRRPRKQAAAASAPTASRPATIKLKFKRGRYDGQNEPALQGLLTAPPSEDTPLRGDGDDIAASTEDVELPGQRRGERKRKQVQREDLVYGSEMDRLLGSSTAEGKVGFGEDMRMSSTPPVIFNLQPTSFPPTILANSPRLTPTTSPDTERILATLSSSAEIQIDLPNMYASDSSEVKPYTAALLNELYIASYHRGQWNTCDLIADTWIRALQSAHQTRHGGKRRKNKWRANAALDKAFQAGRFGFKKDAEPFALDVEDPDLAPDVPIPSPSLLRQLYTRLPRGAGALLLWSDALALTGRAGEREFVRHRDDWPEGLFYDVMCTGLRMVGRKLTLKIEERYAGAWCRYHTHGRRGGVCYAVLAAEQEGRKKRKRGADEGGGKRVRFGEGSAGVDRGAESEVSEEG